MCEQHNTGDSHYNNKRQKPIFIYMFILFLGGLIFLSPPGVAEDVYKIVMRKWLLFQWLLKASCGQILTV